MRPFVKVFRFSWNGKVIVVQATDEHEAIDRALRIYRTRYFMAASPDDLHCEYIGILEN